MAKLYYNLIKANKKTLDDVPLRWREEVRKMLEAENEDN
nr:MAG TPA: hypothetical protein [Caudoviricetes sp.]